MNTTLTVRLDEDIKKTFLLKSREKGVDGAVLVRLFIEKFNQNPELVSF